MNVELLQILDRAIYSKDTKMNYLVEKPFDISNIFQWNAFDINIKTNLYVVVCVYI